MQKLLLFVGGIAVGLAVQMAIAQSQNSNIVRVNHVGIAVPDLDEAVTYYTETLGFQKKHDFPLGKHRWLTVVSPEDPDGTELVLEPDEHPAAKPFKSALVEDGIPFTSFAVRDVAAEYERLQSLGVNFTQRPVDYGTVITAVFDDTCGNLVQIAQEVSQS